MINQIFNKQRPIFSNFFGRNGGDTRIATLADINQIVKEINANTGSVNHIIKISQSGTTAPTFQYMTSGDIDNCKSNCSGGSGSGCVCDCPKDCTNEVATSTHLAFAYAGVGDYVLTASFLGTVYNKGIFDVALFLTPPQTNGDRFSVAASANADKTIWTFRIKTFGNNDGALANGILNGAFAEIKVFTY